MTTTHTPQATNGPAVLDRTFELGWTEWKLGFSRGLAGARRRRTIRARDLAALWPEVARAKPRVGVAADTVVSSGDEAGREGCWLHRALTAPGLGNLVVASARLEGKRRGRRTKTDRLDAGTLRTRLIRHCTGEPKVWRVVQVPRVTAEARRHGHRDLAEKKAERTQPSHRRQGFLASGGLEVREVSGDFPEGRNELRRWAGPAVPTDLPHRLWREFARRQVVDRPIRD
jgi:transposase